MCLFKLWIYIHIVVIYSYCGYSLHIYLSLFILWIYIHIMVIYSYCGYSMHIYFILYSETQCISKLDKIGIFIDMKFH